MTRSLFAIGADFKDINNSRMISITAGSRHGSTAQFDNKKVIFGDLLYESHRSKKERSSHFIDDRQKKHGCCKS